MERVLCDLTPFRQITAWYVHAPDLAYRVSPDGSVVCYHADAMANIIATTDGQKAVLTQYAYTPYGRSLGETNLDNTRIRGLATNPYRFVGSQGVMEEVPNLFFMRARYYSAEMAVFLSTDPVKKIGPGWKSQAYLYANQNPLLFTDPDGEWACPWFPKEGSCGPGYTQGQERSFTSTQEFDDFVGANQHDLGSSDLNRENSYYVNHDREYVSIRSQNSFSQGVSRIVKADMQLGTSVVSLI
jgi:RHS repeat-associated protein